MSGSARPTVESVVPPAVVLKVMNPVVRSILQSRLHRLFSKELMLLHVKGRRSGRVYVVPVGRHEHDGRLVVSAGGGWRRNLAGGGDLEVTIDGRRHPARADLVDDPQEVARIFSELVAEVGLKRANRLGLRIHVDRAPSLEELRAALGDRQVLLVSLASRPAG